MDLEEAMTRLEEMGTEQTRKIYRNHGAQEPFFGVKVGDMKKLLRPLKKEQGVVAELYGTGNADAMYLAALAADAKAMSEEDLDRWAEAAAWYMVGEYGVAGLAAEGPHGWAAGLRWIESATPHVACVGWNTLSGWVALRPDDELDLKAIRGLLERVDTSLHEAPNRVRYTMNGFVISVGCYVESLTSEARAIGESLGKVKVDMGGTACKVPAAAQMIDKVTEKGRLGKKRKAIRC
ncbi:MAG: DNA alkylation repair protein [Deltaproteobacteria bacterium]|nr:DNA alkylation repair protein [Deltaproteobacteria bacterium]